MIRRASPKLVAYAAFGAIGCLLGLVLGRPEPTVLGAPFLFAVLVGAALARRPVVRVAVRLDRDRAIEGDTVAVDLELTADVAVSRLDVALRLPDGLARQAKPAAFAITLAAGAPRHLRETIDCRRWGGYAVGEASIRAHDPLRFFVDDGWVDRRHSLRVYPRPATLRSLLRPLETQLFAGNELARTKGEGIEFADIRPFAAGDRIRRINWRMTTRLGQTHVNERRQERNSDVVLFLDAFSDVGRGDDSTRLQAVRGAAALAERYLAEQDRVGLVTFGGILRWLRPGMGPVQRIRLIESLIETDVVFSYAWKEISAIPPGVLPPDALIVAFTPLLDERAIDALLDLGARGFDLAIIEISPMPFIAPAVSVTEALAFRIWRLEREALRDRFTRLGVPIATWTHGEPLARALLELQACRRRPRLARV
ncbi:MAG TPA: DUF58 domain-containing protein [Thermomicrobiales bacterium]|nr:DUF58 domain-containing protein [Thermomicrobiales bacterium]